MPENNIPFHQDKENVQRFRVVVDEASFNYKADEAKILRQLITVYGQINDAYSDAIKWYFDNRKSHRLRSKLIRFLGISCAFLAATWPALQLVGVTGGLGHFLNWLANDVMHLAGVSTNIEIYTGFANQFGYLAAAVGVAALWSDRYGGASVSWIRYMRAITRLQSASACFQVEWSNLLTAGADTNRLRDHLSNIIQTLTKIMDDEMQDWSTVYMDGMSRLSLHLDNAGFSGAGRHDTPSSSQPHSNSQPSSPTTPYPFNPRTGS